MESRSRLGWPWLWLCGSSPSFGFPPPASRALAGLTMWLCTQELRFSSSALAEGQAEPPGAHGLLGKVGQTEGT